MSAIAGVIERELIGGITRSGKYPRVIRSSAESVGTGVAVAIGFYAKNHSNKMTACSFPSLSAEIEGLPLS